nr:hypothetical protein [Tanacetum cinerariifolium]
MSPGHSARVTEAMALSSLPFFKMYRSSYETPSSSSSLELPVQKRYQGTPELILDTNSEEGEIGEKDTDEDEGHGLDDESHGLDDESHGLDDEGHSLDDEGRNVESVGEPLGLGYGALRRQELAVKEDHVYSTFEPTLTTWIDPKDGIAYIDVPAYPPPAPPAQTLPSPEWSSGLLHFSPAPSAVPSPILSPMISLTIPLAIASLDHTQCLDEMPPTLFAAINRYVRELYTRSRVVRDEIFSQRLVLALEAWAGHVDIRIVDMSWAGYDDHRLIHDMLAQQATLRHKLHEMRGRVTALE